MTNPTDLRVLKNKKLIKNAFLELLNTKKFEDITVSQICQKALINRSTFYFHYESKVELLEVIYIDTLTKFSDLMMSSFKVSHTNEYKKYIRKSFEYVTENHQIFEAFLKLDDYKKLDERKIRNLFIEQFNCYSSQNRFNFKKPDYGIFYSRLFASCAIETLYWWLETGMKTLRYTEVENIIVGCLADGMDPTFFS